MAQGLQGIKVVDVSQVAAVPMAARLLADWGADVIHVERPETGDSFRAVLAGLNPTTGVQSDINYVWEHYNRNKRSVTIDLSQKTGQEILYKLVAEADVFLTNLRPFQLEKFKLEYRTLSQLNPRIISAALTGFGKKGPEKDAPAYDHNGYWARAGIPHRLIAAIPELSAPDAIPPAFIPSIGDHVTALCLAYGVMSALFMREKTGVGQEVDVSLFQSGVHQLSFNIAGALVTGQDCQRQHSKMDARNPLATLYQTKDGRWLLFSAVQPARYWSRFCRAIEREDLEHDPRFESPELLMENRAILIQILEEVFQRKTLDQWKPRLRKVGVPWSPIQNLIEVTDDPQARANDFFVSYDHPVYGRIEGVANPVKLSRSPEKVRMPAPEFGQHTEEVLLEHGYTWEDIARFKQQQVIA